MADENTGGKGDEWGGKKGSKRRKKGKTQVAREMSGARPGEGVIGQSLVRQNETKGYVQFHYQLFRDRY